jgi:D-inositol-3-phosphate glycosyltransferase
MTAASERPLGVLLFCPRLWGSAAIERRARVEIRALRSAGHRVSVVTDSRPEAGAADRWPEVASPPLRTLPAPRLLARFTAGKLVWFFAASLRALARAPRGSVDLVVAHTPVSIVAALPWRRRHRARLVYVCHVPPVGDDTAEPQPATGARWPTRLVSGTADSIAVRFADVVLCPSEAARAWHARVRGTKPTMRLPNPIDTERFSPDAAAPKDVDVLFVGRLGPEKGPAVLLRALARLAAPRRVVLFGVGRERSLLERLAAETESDVELRGYQDNDSLPDWYRRARVVVVPSYYESQGLSAAEAIACGTPVIASGVGGLLDVVHPGVNGWLVPPGDPRALAEAMEVALRPGAADGLQLGSYAFSDARFAEELLGVLAEERQRIPESRNASR